MDLLDRLYLPHKRKYLQELGAFLRDKLGEDVIINALRNDLEGEKSDILVIDGIRYENEVEMVRNFNNNLLFFIDAPTKVRYERCKNRGEKGETRISYEEFLVAEGRETERNIYNLKESADHILNNTGTLKELFENVNEIINK